MGRKRKKSTSAAGAKKPKNVVKNTVSDLEYIDKNDYVFHDNLIYVRPYVFEFRANFKPRWRNMTVFDVFCQEFKHMDSNYWIREVKEGRVLSAEKPITMDAVWLDGLEIVHIVHRHESAVRATKIHVVENREGFVVVSKPASIPVHPCGTYRRNSLQFILKAFYGMGTLLSVHRLDKETSGLIIMAKTSEYAARFAKEIKERKVQKTYLAEVKGIFPDQNIECKEPIYWDKREMKAYIRPQGSEAVTMFSKISRDERKNTSIIECRPVTGRTHQIRVHLEHLGYTVINDPIYGTDEVVSGATSWSRNVDTSRLMLTHEVFQDEAVVNEKRKSHLACKWSKHALQKDGRQLSCLEEGKLLSCSNCPQVTNVKNVHTAVMYIHLHALKYQSDEWSFEVPPPPWASGYVANQCDSSSKLKAESKFCSVS